MVKIIQSVFAFLLLGVTSSVLAQTCDNNNNLSGTGKAAQFITGCCKTDADCASGCCSFLRGQCVGPAVAQERASDGGCGHGNPAPNKGPGGGQQPPTTLSTASAAAPATASGTAGAPPSTCSTNANVGLANGSQFITGCCKSDKDCASKCCSFLRGQCVGAVVAQERAVDGGCGFGDAKPNAVAANGATKRRTVERTAAPEY